MLITNSLPTNKWVKKNSTSICRLCEEKDSFIFKVSLFIKLKNDTWIIFGHCC
uniref:Uncharacterized protein n=1 Tax=Lepeophtheirus salmonis TaxID=72036 RepID=A0A0K2U5S8_LEPSM